MSSIKIKRIAGTRSYSGRYHRRGLVVAVVAIAMVVMIGFVALVIDGGRLYVARTELQRAADASSLAAALDMFPDVHNDYVQDITSGYEWASTIAGKNSCMGESVSIVAEQGYDVTFGWLEDPTDLTDSFTTYTPLGYYNAVRVLARRTPSSPGGQVPLTLAQFMGHNQSSVSASAVAVLDDRFVGYRPPVIGTTPLIPLTILKSSEENPEDTYDYQKEHGDDNFGYDPDTGEIVNSDGIPEIRLFPQKGGGQIAGESAPGNFGILNIGVGNQGESTIEEQILNGVSRHQLIN